MIERKKRRIVFLIFFIGLVLLLIQHRFVGIYFDDYGNASLSYGYNNPDIHGTNWGIKDLLSWAKWCYLNWGGRILYASTILFPLIKHSALPFMITQAFVIIGILWLIYDIVLKQSKLEYVNYKWAILVIVSFFLIGQDVHRYGTYWASASVLYVWPLLPFLLSIYLYIKMEEKIQGQQELKICGVVCLCILIFWATFSQEQVGLSVLAFYSIYIVVGHWKEWKRYKIIDISVLTTSGISYLILFMAPGNFRRLGTTEFATLSFGEKIVHNFPILVKCFFSNGIKWLNLLMTFMVIYGAFRIWRTYKKTIILLLLSICSFIICFINFYKPILGTEVMGVVLGCFVIVNTVVVTSIYCIIYEKIAIMALMFAGGISVGCLVISPAIDLRSYIEYIFVIIVVIGCYWVDVTNEKQNKFLKIAIYALLVVVAVVGLKNYYTILKGYEKNYASLHYNEKILHNYNGEKKIYLKKTKNVFYRGPMAYEEHFEGTEYWMKEYYDIPADVEFVWEDIKK